MSSRSGLRKKVVLPVTIIRHNGDQRQLAHTLDLSETSARLGGLSMVLEPGEMVEVQRGQLSAKFQVFWMGAPGSAMEGQAGIRSMEPEKMIWGVPATEPSEPVTETEASSSAKLPGEKRWDARLGCSGAASIQPRGSQIPLHGVVKDVSKGGVYVEMMSPLPVNSEVLLKVNIEGITLEATGVVRTSYPMVGMGISFRDVSHDNLEKLAKILEKTNAKRPENAHVAPAAKPQAPALRLDAYPVHMLTVALRTFASEFDQWKARHSPAEVEELRQAMREAFDKLSPASQVEVMDYLAASLPGSGVV